MERRIAGSIGATLLAGTLGLPGALTAGDSMVCPTMAGTTFRDYSKPCYKIEGNEVQPTIPGTTFRDYTKPGYVRDGKELQPTLPGTSFRDYTRPGYVVDGDSLQPTVPGTGFRDYSKPGFRREGNEICPTLPGMGFRDYSKPCQTVTGEPDTYQNPSLTDPSPGSHKRRRSAPQAYPNLWEPDQPKKEPRQYKYGTDSGITPSRPSIDCSSVPGFCLDGREFYPVIPGTTTRDYTRGGAVIQGDSLCPTLAGTAIRDYGQNCVSLRN